MALTPEINYLILTKRADSMAPIVNDDDWQSEVVYFAREVAMQKSNPLARRTDDLRATYDDEIWPLPNVALGVSVESQKYADERIPHLLETPAAVRFLSCEPLIGPVDLERWLVYYDSLYGEPWGSRGDLHWVIVGGESGPKARPMHPDWARSLRDQCVAAGVPFFFKQHGEWSPQAFGEARGLLRVSDAGCHERCGLLPVSHWYQ